jgi:hypothetical protein
MNLEFSRQILEEYSNFNFNENLPSGSPVKPCGQTDMTKLIVAIRNFVKVPKKCKLLLKTLQAIA